MAKCFEKIKHEQTLHYRQSCLDPFQLQLVAKQTDYSVTCTRELMSKIPENGMSPPYIKKLLHIVPNGHICVRHLVEAERTDDAFGNV